MFNPWTNGDVADINPGLATGQVLAQQQAVTNKTLAEGNVLIPAQAEVAKQTAELTKQQAIGASIENQIKGMNIGNILGTTRAQGQTNAEATGGAQPGATPQVGVVGAAAQGPSPTTPTASVDQPGNSTTPGSAPLTPPTQQGVQKAQATTASVDQGNAEAVNQHAASTPITKDGAPNFLSDAYLTRVRDLSIANGVQPQYANDQFVAATKARLEISKSYADVYKAQQDGKVSAETAAQQHLDTNNDLAHQAVVEYASNPAAASGIAHSLGIDINTPQGMAQLMAMDASSPKGQAEQKQANENANVASEIQARTVANSVSQRQLAVSQGNLNLGQLAQGTEMMRGAVGTANTVDSSNRLLDDVNAVQQLRSIPGATSIKGGSAYALTQSLPPDLKNNLIKNGATLEANGKTLVLDNYLHRIIANTGELKNLALAQGGAAGAAGSDSRLGVVTESVAGNAIDLLKAGPAMDNSLSVIKNFAKTTGQISGQTNANYNQYLQKNGQGIFNPVAPAYKRQSPPDKGDIVDGHVFLGGNPKDPKSWRQ